MKRKVILIAIILSVVLLLHRFAPEVQSGPSAESQMAFDEGLGYLQAGNFPKAEEAFYRAIANAPSWDEAYRFYGITLKSLGKYAQAIQSFQKAYELKPSNINTLEGLVSTSILQELPDQAELYLKQMILFAPEDPKTWQYQGYLLHMRGKFQEASEFLEKSLVDPKNNLAYYRLADCYHQLQQEGKRFQLYQQALEKHPKEVSLVRSYLSMAQDLEREKEATLRLQQLYQNPPNAENKPWYQLYLGQTLLQKRDTESEGKTHLNQILSFQELALDAALVLARKELMDGDFTSAEQHLNQGLDYYPFHPTLLKLLGDVYRFQKEPQKALSTYESWFIYTKDLPVEKKMPVFLSQVQTYIDLKQWDKAKNILDETETALKSKVAQGSLFTQENLWKIAHERVLLDRYQGKWNEALSQLETLQKIPNLSPIFASSFLLETAFTYWVFQKTDQACVCFRRVRHEYPQESSGILLSTLFEGILTKERALFLEAQKWVDSKQVPMDAFTKASIQYLAETITDEVYSQTPRSFFQENDYHFFRAMKAPDELQKKEWLQKAAQFSTLTDFPSFLAQTLLNQ